MKKLNLLDMAFLLADDETTPMHVGGVHIYHVLEGTVKDYLDRYMTKCREATEVVKPFNYKLHFPNLSHPRPHLAEDPEFDLSDHIHRHTLPQPGTRETWMAYVSELHNKRLDFKKPLWQLHIIEGLEGNRFSLYFKVHHTMLDGVTGMRIFAAMLHNDPADRSYQPFWQKGSRAAAVLNPAKPKAPQAKPTLGSLVNKQIGTLGEVAKTLMDMNSQQKSNEDVMLPLPFNSPDTPWNGRLSSKRLFAPVVIPIAEMTELAKRQNCTLNDAIMALCSGALRRYLAGKHCLPDQPLTAFVPVSVRKEGDQRMDNKVSMMICNLGTHREKAGERLDLIKRSMNKGKTLLKSISSESAAMMALLSATPGFLLKKVKLSQYTPPQFNVVISNVPGPLEALYLDGALLEEAFPLSVLYDRMGLNITVISYHDRLLFGLIACQQSLPDLHKMMDHFQQSLDELKSL